MVAPTITIPTAKAKSSISLRFICGLLSISPRHFRFDTFFFEFCIVYGVVFYGFLDLSCFEFVSCACDF